MLEILLRGVSTRNYQRVLPEMADTVGVLRSSVSREAIEAAEAERKRLLERRFDAVNLLVICLDGMQFGDTQVIAAVGVDEQGRKHVLGIQEGATENAAAAKDLLERLVAHGVKPEPKLLFVIDGSKALRAAIRAVFGAEHPVQRCRTHKLRNVLERLPEEQKDQVRAALRAAWRLEAKAGMARLEKLAQWLDHFQDCCIASGKLAVAEPYGSEWPLHHCRGADSLYTNRETGLERDYPAAAASVREGLEECFTLNRLGIPPSLHRCLATTNRIESPQAGVRMRTRRVCCWRDATMVKRWVAAAFLATEQNFRRLMGYQDLWMLEAILRGPKSVPQREVA